MANREERTYRSWAKYLELMPSEKVKLLRDTITSLKSFSHLWDELDYTVLPILDIMIESEWERRLKAR